MAVSLLFGSEPQKPSVLHEKFLISVEFLNHHKKVVLKFSGESILKRVKKILKKPVKAQTFEWEL
jgi:hypothetical protein